MERANITQRKRTAIMLPAGGDGSKKAKVTASKYDGEIYKCPLPNKTVAHYQVAEV